MGRESPTPPLPRKHSAGQSPDSSSSDGSAAATAICRAKKSRYPVDGEEDDCAGDRVECSGKYCRSCSAGMIADCVALCCCPCALVNLLTLALVKVPWMVGRRCLGLGKNNKKKKIKNQSQGQNRKSKQKCKSSNDKTTKLSGSSSHRQRRCAAEEELPEQISWYDFGCDDREEEEEEEEEDCVSSAERVWLELYQVGHLGFGRVSFSGGGVQSVQGKGSLGT